MKINVYPKIITIFLVTEAVSSQHHIRHGRRTVSSDDCAIMKLVQDAMTETEQGFAGFFDSLSNEDFGKDVTDLFNNLNNESGGALSGFFGKASQAFSDFSGMWEDEYAMSNPSRESDENPKMTTIVETISYHQDADGYTSDKTVETTKTYLDGHTTRTIENMPGPILEQDASFEDIMMGYKDVIESITPKMLKLSEDMTKDLTSAFDEMFEKFEDKTKGMDTENVLELSDVSKEELLKDYEEFSSSYEQLENVDEIGENEDVSNKFDKLADNFSKIMKFA